MPELTPVTGTAAALDRLTEKLEAWLMQQPEWPQLFEADRRARRRAAQVLAQRIYTIPHRRRPSV